MSGSQEPPKSEQPAGEPGSASAAPRVTAVDLAVECIEGTLRAVGDGAQVFQRQVELKHLLEPGARSGLVGALISGSATYFEGMAKVANDVARGLRSAEASKKPGEE